MPNTTTDKPFAFPYFALGFIMICLAGYLLNKGAAIIIPFVIALFVWYLINAMARGFSRLTVRGRRVDGLWPYLLSILVLVAGMWLTYELISANAADVAAVAPLYQDRLTTFLPDMMQRLPEEYRPNAAAIANYLDVGAFAKVVLRTFTGIAGKTLIVFFYTGFLLYEQQFFARKMQEMFRRPETKARVLRVLRNIDDKIQLYILVKTLVSVAVGILTWILLKIFQIDFAEFWGVIAFLLNFIPYVGPLVAIVLPTVVALVQTGDLSTSTLVFTALSAIHGVIGHILDPYLMGNNLNLSPIFIITNLAIWEMIWGVPGMFLAIPILAIIVITLAQFDATRPIAVLMTKTGEVDKDKIG